MTSQLSWLLLFLSRECAESLHLCPTLCYAKDHSSPVRGIGAMRSVDFHSAQSWAVWGKAMGSRAGNTGCRLVPKNLAFLMRKETFHPLVPGNKSGFLNREQMTFRLFCSLRLPVSRVKDRKGHRWGLRDQWEGEPKGKEGSRRKQGEFRVHEIWGKKNQLKRGKHYS